MANRNEPDATPPTAARAPNGAAASGAATADDAATRGQPFAVSAPQVALPKGGGAIRGIGEKFAVAPVTGTGAMTVPIATSPGRSGFGPQLALSYDSGVGNGPFGVGWSLSIPTISRKTEKGLPQYRDADESDVYLLSGAEDLVPVLNPDGTRFRDDTSVPGYLIHRYRPRIEGLFARIERWTHVATEDIHWRSITPDNILTVYGLDGGSRIADPLDERRVYTWLICETRDDKGNAMLFRYKAEDGLGADLARAHQANRGPRTDSRRAAARYPKRIHYGNRTPLLDSAGHRPLFLDPGQVDNAGWMFEVVFDYGEHADAAPAPAEQGAWSYRPDAFSVYRPGFEVRTTRLCRRVLMFHHFPAAPGVGRDCLVRSTDFDYSAGPDPGDTRNPVYTFLRKVTQTGYRRNNGGYDRRSLPPVEFGYTEPVVQDTVEQVAPDSLDNLPAGLDGRIYRWTDLHGEGIPGILTEQAGAWYYKRNLSPLPGAPAVQPKARFAPLETVALKPNLALAGRAELMDLAGDGQTDAVVLDGPLSGLYEHDEGEGWQPFRPFASCLNRDPRDPNVRFIDLDGDGRADVLITEEDAFVWHASLAEQGFGPARRVARALDEEKGARVVFADGTQSIYLADFSGDGLADIVRIRNGEICYWPNLGYGRFGAKVTMDDAPLFDNGDQFDQQRVRLADIDGSGTTDIIYLHRDGVRLYFNQSGNSWSQPRLLNAFPVADDVASIVPVDLFGNGTICLVWSSPLPVEAGHPMRFVNLMGGQKPHLLARAINNLGAETHIGYASSTSFYLQDKRDGRPWITRLPFPVSVVERVETFDHVCRNRFVTRYAYHHGCFDGEEREFRGFGMVDQWDTEQIGALTADGAFPQGDNISAQSHVPPVHTRTWFHTGYVGSVPNAIDPAEYFREPGLEGTGGLLLPDTVLPPGLTLEEEREACRALKGLMLRQEVYAEDAGPDASAGQARAARMPYTVTGQNYSIRALQPRGANQHAVFFTHASEMLEYHYERNPSDPRIQHSLVLEVDAYGNVLKQAAVGYGRRKTIRVVDEDGQVQELPNPGFKDLQPSDQDRQTTALLTYTENRVTNAIDLPDAYCHPLPCETITFELTGYTPSGPDGRFQASDLVEPDPAAPGRLRHKFTAELPYESAGAGTQLRRPIEWMRTLYRRDDLCGLLPLGEVQALGVPGESYRLAFTPGLLAQVYQRAGQPLLPDPAAVLGGQAGERGGYLRSQALEADGSFPASDADDHWWVPSGQSFFSTSTVDCAAELSQARQHFFLPRRYRDPFGQDTFVDFDADDLLMAETRDALGNRVTVDANDYRVLQPRLVSDPNRNQSEVAFDTLGMVAGTAVMGKPLPAPVEGDTLAGFAADLAQAELDAFFGAADPRTAVPGLLRGATTRIVYDLDRFQRTQQENPGDPARWQPACAATLARESHVSGEPPRQGLKIQLGFTYSDGFGREIQKKVQAEPGPVVEGGPVADRRWVGSGWTVFNNKGKPVRQYEPFFSATHQFEFGVMAGVSPVLFYDPAERVIATLHPNHSFEKVVFDPWQQTTYDVNDTCAGDPRTDPDIAGYVAAYFKTQPASWQTWHAQRIGGALGQHEENAALRAAAHADTPGTMHFDVLGRPFLTVARNRVACPGHDLDGTKGSFYSRVELDIEGNQHSVRDAIEQAGDPLGRVVMRYAYDMLGNRVHQLSMEAGARWMLGSVDGKPIRAWDSRGHDFTTVCDTLRRPMEQYVRGTTADSDPRTLNPEPILVERIEYGEGLANAETLNLRTRIYRHFDSAGVATNARLDAGGNPVEAYDFKGNLLRSTRRLVSDYKAIPDWRSNPPMEAESFEGSSRYDALNRGIQSVAPHSSLARAKRNVIQHVFNEANLLERVDVWLERADEPAGLLDPDSEAPSPVGVANVDYDAKGQRQRIDYKNGSSTRYDYDPATFRLVHLYTRRGAAFAEDCDNLAPPPPTTAAPETAPRDRSCGLQNLHYTYDPAGNITHIQDDAKQTIYFRNQRVEPSNDYTYDALYRLIQASGREHLGQQAGGARNAPTAPDASNTFPTRLEHPGDGKAMGTYIERYVYDAVGNFLQMQHRGSDPAHAGWTRAYDYLEPSLIEDGSGGTVFKTSNRLSRTTLSPNGAKPAQVEPYQHDVHGNMVRMPHLGGGSPGPNMRWDYQDRLRQTDLGGGGEAYYVYDGAGQRVRKVVGKGPGLTEERIYFAGFEIYRRHDGPIGADTAALERESLHVLDDQQRIALVETRTLDTRGNDSAPQRLIRYQFGNHLGSASLELNDIATVISYEEYCPYGSTAYQALDEGIKAASKRYRYTGKERDEESGFYYYGERYSAPWLGRWVACDPAGLIEGTDLYSFTMNNPLRMVDANGTDSSESPFTLTVSKESAFDIDPGTRSVTNIETSSVSLRVNVPFLPFTLRHTESTVQGQIAGERAEQYLDFSDEEGLVVERPQTEHERYQKVYQRALAHYQEGAGAPRGIDSLAQVNFFLAGIAVGAVGAVAVAGTTWSSAFIQLLGGGVGGLIGDAAARKVTAAALPEDVDPNLREFVEGFFGQVGGALGGFAGHGIAKQISPPKGLALGEGGAGKPLPRQSDESIALQHLSDVRAQVLLDQLEQRGTIGAVGWLESEGSRREAGMLIEAALIESLKKSAPNLFSQIPKTGLKGRFVSVADLLRLGGGNGRPFADVFPLDPPNVFKEFLRHARRWYGPFTLPLRYPPIPIPKPPKL
jgi:RHS repeat-associated protein